MEQLTFAKLVASALPHIKELMPWDVDAMRQTTPDLLIVDIRETDEYAAGHIQGALLVPRGVLEASCDWGYSDTLPVLVQARNRPVVLVLAELNRDHRADPAANGIRTGVFNEDRRAGLE